jgi:hypothetical protein
MSSGSGTTFPSIGRVHVSTLVADLVAGELIPVYSATTNAINNTKYFIRIAS